MVARFEPVVDHASCGDVHALINWMLRPGGTKACAATLATRVGERVLHAAVEAGWVEVRQAMPGEWLLGGCGCGADLEAFDCGELVWLCVDGYCAPRPASRVAWTDGTVFGGAVARALALGPSRSGLGVLRVAGHEVAFDGPTFAREPALEISVDGSVAVEVSLTDLLRPDGGEVHVDLRRLVRRARLPIAVAGALFGRASELVLAEGTVWVRGEEVDLGPRGTVLFQSLARDAGAWVEHRDLQAAVWDDEVTASGRARCGWPTLDRRLRQLVAELRAALPEGAIEGRRAGGGRPGAYRLVASVECVDPAPPTRSSYTSLPDLPGMR